MSDQDSGLVLVETVPVETTLGAARLPEPHIVWQEMVDAAESSIVVAQFYVVSEPGKRMEPILNSIEAAAKRGVRVRFLLDAKFAKTYPEGVERVQSVKEFETELLDLDTRFGGVLHAKYFIVDGKDAYVGSQNFDWRSLEHIVELGVRIRDQSLVDSLAGVFERDWALARGEESSATSRGSSPSRPRLPANLCVSLRDTVRKHCLRTRALGTCR